MKVKAEMAKGRSHYKVAAKEARTMDGIVFGSKLEMRAYVYLKADRKPGQKLLIHVSLPLWSSAPTVGVLGRTHINIDFIFVELVDDVWRIVRACDAKPKRYVSRDWKRGKDAFEASYGVKIEEFTEV